MVFRANAKGLSNRWNNNNNRIIQFDFVMRLTKMEVVSGPDILSTKSWKLTYTYIHMHIYANTITHKTHKAIKSKQLEMDFNENIIRQLGFSEILEKGRMNQRREKKKITNNNKYGKICYGPSPNILHRMENSRTYNKYNNYPLKTIEDKCSESSR